MSVDRDSFGAGKSIRPWFVVQNPASGSYLCGVSKDGVAQWSPIKAEAKEFELVDTAHKYLITHNIETEVRFLPA